MAGLTKIVLLAALIASSDSHGNDLGVLGKTYPIIEQDMAEAIVERLKEKQASGELDKLHRKLRDDSKAYVKRPLGRELPRAKVYRSVQFDPTVTIEKDIKDSEGRVLYPAGTLVNPLDYKPLSKTLCFINADDAEQIDWVTQYCPDEVSNKIILVHGDFIETGRKLNRRIYFDQRGKLTDHFGIQAVPTVIRQNGRYLYVEEFKIN